MARITESSTEHESTTNSRYHSESTSKSESQSQSATRKVLDEVLRDRILSGLMGTMTDEEIDAYAENLLVPQRNAGLEAAQQKYDAAKLTGEQEIESLAAELARSIAEQKRSYAQSAANVETAALSRGMGRSSYTLETLANTGDRLSRAVKELTDASEQKTAQTRARMALAAQQNAATQGRLNADYARELAAKVQELKESQRKEYNQNYLTAVSGSMGSATSGTSSSQGSSVSDATGTSHTQGSSSTVTKSYSTGGKSSKSSSQVDAISSAAPSVKYRR
ncbi:MAG: hypothetical protein MR637_07805 [Clostridiales bacterium]|nr:hypothetical protein [Clostridiales bacterium]